MSKRALKIVVKYLLLSVFLWPLGVIWHELVGHGLVGVLCGGKIERVEILTIQVWPELKRMPWEGHYGMCNVTSLPTPREEAITALGGALSTFCVALVTAGLLLLRKWGRYTRPLLITLSFWWIDLLAYMLPSWGLPRSVFWGQDWYSEPYEAAVDLGIAGPLFQILTIAGCVILASVVGINLFYELKHRHSAESVRAN